MSCWEWTSGSLNFFRQLVLDCISIVFWLIHNITCCSWPMDFQCAWTRSRVLTCSFNESGLTKNLNLFRSQHAVSFNIWKYGILLDSWRGDKGRCLKHPWSKPELSRQLYVCHNFDTTCTNRTTATRHAYLTPSGRNATSCGHGPLRIFWIRGSETCLGRRLKGGEAFFVFFSALP